ncbi:MAG: ROK family protein [Candidatus Sumerlaeia bacterium]|nr:ROK family protein [Candidatus Sumerlaeia bacterium]
MATDGGRIVIGVDGGGTKTAGILFCEDGKELATHEVGSTNPHSNPEDTESSRMKELIETLLDQGKLTRDNLDGICLGMAGCDRPADRNFLDNIVRRHVATDTPILLVNDAMVAMVGVIGRLHGILVIAGTGSICFGFDETTGTKARCGGWGHYLGDEGSGFLIGLEGLRAIMREFDECAEKTSLTKEVLAHLKLDSPTDLIGWTYMQGNGKPEIAALARLVHEQAAAGDSISIRILETQATDLANQVATVYKRLFAGREGTIPLALWGGNLQHVDLYRKLFTDRVADHKLPLEPVMKDVPAMIGAARHMLNNL